MRLLALDLGKQVGWCLMERHHTPRFGTFDLEVVNGLHGRLGRFSDWLDTMWANEKPDGIAWEGALLMPWDRIEELLLLYGLNGLSHQCAWRHDLPWRVVPVPDVKTALLGESRAPKDNTITKAQARAKTKARVIAAARKMDWDVRSDHEAEAGGVGLCAYSLIWPKSPDDASTTTHGAV